MNSLAPVYCLESLYGKAHANLELFSLDFTPILWPNGCAEALTLSAVVCGWT